jgi:hypothetical protein
MQQMYVVWDGVLFCYKQAQVLAQNTKGWAPQWHVHFDLYQSSVQLTGSRIVRGGQKMVSKCVLHISCAFMVWEKIWAQSAVLIALTAHHTPTITSCNNASWIDMGFPADKYLLLCEFIYPLRQTQSSLKTEE